MNCEFVNFKDVENCIITVRVTWCQCCKHGKMMMVCVIYYFIVKKASKHLLLFVTACLHFISILTYLLIYFGTREMDCYFQCW